MDDKLARKTARYIRTNFAVEPEVFERLGLTIDWRQFRQPNGKMGKLEPVIWKDGKNVSEFTAMRLILTEDKDGNPF